jgi:iron complex transport system ATP-binding protein
MALLINRINLQYGKQVVLNNFTAQAINPGQLHALIGANGAGKSSLFRMISGVEKTKSGQVSLDEIDLKLLTLSQRALHICYVPQLSATQVRLTVFEALILTLSLNKQGLAQIQKEAKVGEILTLLKLGALANQLLCDLSGGQQQLVSLGQGLIRDPAVLLLDEPTSALDLAHQLSIMQLLVDYVKKNHIICIIAIHDLNLVSRFCPQLIALKQGHCIRQGPTNKVLDTSLSLALFGVQLNKIKTDSGYDLIDAQLC